MTKNPKPNPNPFHEKSSIIGITFECGNEILAEIALEYSNTITVGQCEPTPARSRTSPQVAMNCSGKKRPKWRTHKQHNNLVPRDMF